MAHTRKTFALGGQWDLELDASGQILLATDDAATAQNVANECRLFTDDAIFAKDRGIPYFTIAFGDTPMLSVIASRWRKAALLVEDVRRVTNVEVIGVDRETRELTGEITFTTQGGNTYAVEL